MIQEFIPYGRQTVNEADIDAVEAVLRSPYLTQGPVVPAFERGLRKAVKSRHAVAVNSATSALHIACIGVGLKPGGLLWTSPITFVASANCGRYCGANVDFVDIDPATGQMCTTKLKKKLIKAAKQNCLPNVLIPVHLGGTSCQMKEIREMTEHYNIKIVEDGSHAIGGQYRKKPIGNCEYSDATVFSFHPVKIITCGEGGAVTCNDNELSNKLEMLRSHGITKDESNFEMKSSGPWTYEQQMLGFNYRMTDIQAALGLSQLNRLDDIVKKRNDIYERYTRLLSRIPVEFLSISDECYSALHLAVIKVNKLSSKTHRKIFEELRAAGIGVQLHYTPVHLQPYYRRMGFQEGDFPAAEAYAKSAISIPLFPELKEDEQDRVIRAITELAN